MALMLFCIVTGAMFFKSLASEAIWRGFGLEPVIRRADRPFDYFAFLSLLAFLAGISLAGALWLLAAGRRASK